jgi:trehalose synthase
VARLDDYRSIVGAGVLEELALLGERLRGRSVLHVNSTAVGGGVAEILNRLVPLLGELGMDARWEVIRGGEDFYAVTKKFHNALHGDPVEVTPRDYQVYEAATDENLSRMPLDADIVFIHDPQPAALVKRRRERLNRWIWRCHIDISRRDPAVWGFLKPYVESYDACVVSAPSFAQDLSIRQALIPPSIDPLSDKNRELSTEEVRAVLDRLQVPTDKPLVTQVSRFDRLKDPLGVLEAYRKVKPYVDCRLLLVGGSADDDPEGAQVLAEVREKAAGDPDVLVLCLPPTSHVEINALQRASTVILQKSLREGFGLTVSEALWKGKPVIAGAVGGIPLQIAHKYSGVLVHSVDGAAYWLKQLLSEPEYARKLGENGREGVRQNFLLTRHLRDYMLLFLAVCEAGAAEAGTP